MAGYIVYWPKNQMTNLKREKDSGPISVVYGSAHSRMPSINSVRVGDIVFPVTLLDGTFYAVARLPVEEIEPAYQYLIRELGNHCGALLPEDMDRSTYKDTPLKPHHCHQKPFSCCSQRAAQGTKGSSIRLRPFPKDTIPKMRFGPTESKMQTLALDKNENPAIRSLQATRRMSDETLAIFEELFIEMP